MQLEELNVYKSAMNIGQQVWVIVNKWEYFEKSSLGKQLTRAADSVAANLSEGYGRYHFKENRQFAYYSRGSLYETMTWLTKANQRQLISQNNFDELNRETTLLTKMLNSYISSIGKSPSH